MNIWYFFLSNHVYQGYVDIQFCPTDEMVGDYMTKPLQEAKFLRFQCSIVGYQEPAKDNYKTSKVYNVWTINM